MMKLNTINDKEEMKIGKSDFITEHGKKGKLTQFYTLDEDKVIGQGIFIDFFHIFDRKFWHCSDMYTQSY